MEDKTFKFGDCENAGFNFERFITFISVHRIENFCLNNEEMFQEMLYSIGVAISDKYQYKKGYELFKKDLKIWLGNN